MLFCCCSSRNREQIRKIETEGVKETGEWKETGGGEETSGGRQRRQVEAERLHHLSRLLHGCQLQVARSRSLSVVYTCT